MVAFARSGMGSRGSRSRGLRQLRARCRQLRRRRHLSGVGTRRDASPPRRATRALRRRQALDPIARDVSSKDASCASSDWSRAARADRRSARPARCRVNARALRWLPFGRRLGATRKGDAKDVHGCDDRGHQLRERSRPMRAGRRSLLRRRTETVVCRRFTHPACASGEAGKRGSRGRGALTASTSEGGTE